MLSERQHRITKRILAQGEPLSIKELVAEEGVSLQTIYSDLRSIEKARFRVDRGRVGFFRGEDGKSVVGEKVSSDRGLREKACDYVAEMILKTNPKGLLFIDGGSTGYIFFEVLRRRVVRDCVIVTNNPLVIGSLADDEDFFRRNSVFAMAGRLDPVRISLYSIGRRHDIVPGISDDSMIDACVLGVRALSDKADLYIENEEEVSQKMSLIAKSMWLVVIVTPGKLGARGLFKIASLSREAEKKRVDVVVASEGALSGVASDAFERLAELLGRSSVTLVGGGTLPER